MMRISTTRSIASALSEMKTRQYQLRAKRDGGVSACRTMLQEVWTIIALQIDHRSEGIAFSDTARLAFRNSPARPLRLRARSGDGAYAKTAAEGRGARDQRPSGYF